MLTWQDFLGQSRAEWTLALVPVVHVSLSGIWSFLEGGTHTRGPWDTPHLWSGSVCLILCGLRVAGQGPFQHLTGSPKQLFLTSG